MNSLVFIFTNESGYSERDPDCQKKNNAECSTQLEPLFRCVNNVFYKKCLYNNFTKFRLDIGLYLSAKEVHVDLRRELLMKPWHPRDSKYDFPATYRKRQNGTLEKRGINENHFKKHTWLAYTHIERGLLCKYCVLFGQEEAGRGNQELLRLVSKPLQKFDKLTGKDGYLTTHENRDYHKNAVCRGIYFLQTGKLSVLEQLYQADEETQKKNKMILRSIIRAILICGRTGHSLRGHRDSGNPLQGPMSGDGLFREILRAFVDLGDTDLEQHFNSGPKNAQYTSPEIQNELISICGEIIKKQLVSRINLSHYFTVIADETTDNGKLEQLSLCVRYLDDDYNIREDFLKFVVIDDLSGAGIAKVITGELLTEGLDLSLLIGMAFDGASAMAGNFNGAQAHIKKKYPMATYLHCASHCLNLVISDSSKSPTIRSCWSSIQAITSFLQYGKRLSCLEEMILSKYPESQRTRLPTFSDTRWIDRHDGVLLFKQFISPIKSTLEEIMTWSGKGDGMASILLKSIDGEFVVALTVLEAILARTRPVSKLLQEPHIDIKVAMDMVDNVVGLLRNWRETASETFHRLFVESEGKLTKSPKKNICCHSQDLLCIILALANNLDQRLKLPRIAKRQVHRENVPADCPEEYYR
jgi:hypothetical protein